MRRLIVFNAVSLDGYYASVDGDMSFAHKQDAEWTAFVEGNASAGGELLFGRITYELMVSYWPTPLAARNSPAVAGQMNARRKVVFSRTLREAAWSNTRLVDGDIAAEIRKMKEEPGPPMTILGSGIIVRQLTEERLIDEYQVVVVPVVLGGGKSMFSGIKEKLNLRLIGTRAFGNGNVLLCYEPMP
ncbi:MAG: dihydrofolate reductase family protein [Bryobacteraceae bacterium]